jgi:hypothetical protein
VHACRSRVASSSRSSPVVKDETRITTIYSSYSSRMPVPSPAGFARGAKRGDSIDASCFRQSCGRPILVGQLAETHFAMLTKVRRTALAASAPQIIPLTLTSSTSGASTCTRPSRATRLGAPRGVVGLPCIVQRCYLCASEDETTVLSIAVAMPRLIDDAWSLQQMKSQCGRAAHRP